MAQNVYECMFIFDSNAYARDPNGVGSSVQTMVENCGGELLASRLWNEQKLAYPIDKHRKGTYWLSYFRMPGEKVSEFNRACQLNGSVIRNLTLKVDPRLVEALVAHATGRAVTPAAEESDDSDAASDAAPAKEDASSAEKVTADS